MNRLDRHSPRIERPATRYPHGGGEGDGNDGMKDKKKNSAGDDSGAPRRVKWGKQKKTAAGDGASGSGRDAGSRVGRGEGKDESKGDDKGGARVRGRGNPDVPAPLECTQKAGQLIYVPEGWYHSTINLEETIGVGDVYRPFARAVVGLWPASCSGRVVVLATERTRARITAGMVAVPAARMVSHLSAARSPRGMYVRAAPLVVPPPSF